MKNHTIKTPTAELLIVELSEGLTQMRKNTLSVMQHDGWELLGKPDEIKERDVVDLVHKNELGYTNYNAKTASQAVFSKFPTATESLLSLLESEIYWENPFPYPSPYDPRSKTGRFEHGEELENAERNYNEAESRTFDKQRTFIFVKN